MGGSAGAAGDGSGVELLPTPTAAASKPASWKDDGRPWWLQSRAARGLEAILTGRTPVLSAPDDGPVLPTPTAYMVTGPGGWKDREGSPNLQTAVGELVGDERLLPTPMARDVKDSGFPPRLDARDDGVPSALKRLLPQDDGVPLLPTPAVNDMGAGKTPEQWDEWTDKMREAHANGNGHGPSLSIEALRLLPTPNTMDSMGARSAEALASAQERGGCRNLKDVVPHELGEGESPGPGLLPTPTVSDARDGSHVRSRALRRMEDGVTTSYNLNHLFENDEMYAFHMGGRIPTGDDDDELMLFDMVRRPAGAPRLLPTPETGESLTGHGRRGGRPGNGRQSGESLDAVAEVLTDGKMLPTPRALDASGVRGKTDNRSDAANAKAGVSLTDVAKSLDGDAPLLGTPGAMLGEGGGRRSAEYLNGRAPNPQELVDLLPTPATANTKSERAMTASTENGRRSGGGQSSPLGLEETAVLMSGEVPEHIPDYEELPPASQRTMDGFMEPVSRFGPYEVAIRRWEAVLGREAPSPSIPGKTGRPRLNPGFVEWMMALPAGWVTDPVIGLPHNAQLKALGNGVVPLQAFLALHLLLGPLE